MIVFFIMYIYSESQSGQPEEATNRRGALPDYQAVRGWGIVPQPPRGKSCNYWTWWFRYRRYFKGFYLFCLKANNRWSTKVTCEIINFYTTQSKQMSYWLKKENILYLFYYNLDLHHSDADNIFQSIRNYTTFYINWLIWYHFMVKEILTILFLIASFYLCSFILFKTELKW